MLVKMIDNEKLRKYRIKLKCPSCDYFEDKTVSEENLDDYDAPVCGKCGNSSSMEIIEKIDMIDELSDLAEKTGGKIEIISLGSEEGDSLYSAFSGVAGILRYPVDL